MKIAICFCILVLPCLGAPPVKFLTLRHLGAYSGVDNDGVSFEKKYFISQYLKLTPPAARSYCKSFGPNMDLVSFDSRNEFLVVRAKLEPEVTNKSITVIVGGFANIDKTGKRDYHWIASGVKKFSDLEVPQDRMCLGIQKEKNQPVTFVPLSCDESLKFMCQEMEVQYAN